MKPAHCQFFKSVFLAILVISAQQCQNCFFSVLHKYSYHPDTTIDCIIKVPRSFRSLLFSLNSQWICYLNCLPEIKICSFQRYKILLVISEGVYRSQFTTSFIRKTYQKGCPRGSKTPTNINFSSRTPFIRIP